MVLSASGKEQNMHYPPYIFEAHYNAVTGWLLDELAKQYPANKSIVDIARPFLKSKMERVELGRVKLPDDCRNLLGAGIFVSPDFKEDCGCLVSKQKLEDDPLALSEQEVQQKKERAKAITHDLIMRDIDEWNRLITHSYKKPTLKKASATSKDAGYLNVAPFDLTYVELRYFRKPKKYRFGYKNNGDDTYVFDPNTSEESEWTENATQYLFKGLNTLYSMYAKDAEMRDWNLELKKIGLF